MSDQLTTIIVLIVMLTGMVGTLVPILPGIALMWAGAVGYAFVVGFDAMAIGVLIAISALTVAATAVGVLLPKRAAADSGASTASQIAAAVGAVIGFFVIPIIGVVIGALIGIAVAEWFDKRDWPAAWASTIAVAKGLGISALIQFGIAFMILVVWSVWALTVVL